MWNRIWAVLADYFITVGCHSNLSVAMYAVDSLRQLAMKFLERDELTNYTFQNDFLRPFVVVMRQSQVRVCVCVVAKEGAVHARGFISDRSYFHRLPSLLSKVWSFFIALYLLPLVRCWL